MLSLDTPPLDTLASAFTPSADHVTTFNHQVTDNLPHTTNTYQTTDAQSHDTRVDYILLFPINNFEWIIHFIKLNPKQREVPSDEVEALVCATTYTSYQPINKPRVSTSSTTPPQYLLVEGFSQPFIKMDAISFHVD